ncbi:MAG: hypothetical protein SNJ64_02185 [Endomicrobiia bacterium]
MKKYLKLGRSGCKIKIFDHYVMKFCDENYEKRLIQQALKQAKHSSPEFIVPKVFSIGKNYFTMEKMKNALNIIDTDENVIRRFVELLYSFIKRNLENSCSIKVSIEVFKQKWGKFSSLIKFRLPEYIEVPIGYCHGDLTLCNVFYDITSCNFILIDFLDSYLESPLCDLVKIYQDINHKWIFKILNKKCEISHLFKKLEELNFPHLFSLFNFTNLCSVYRYTSGKLKKHLEREIYEYKHCFANMWKI